MSFAVRRHGEKSLQPILSPRLSFNQWALRSTGRNPAISNQEHAMQSVFSVLCLILGIVSSVSVAGQVSAEDLVIRPRAMAGPLDNPLKGWCPYTDAGKIHQPYSMVFQYISWRPK